MNVKGLKKCLAGVSTLGLALSLAACNDQESSQSGNNKGYTLSDILNSKEKHQIVVTDDNQSDEEGHVVWAGFVGEGELDGIFLNGMDYDYGYDSLRGQSDKEFKNNLTEMGKDYDAGDKSTFATSKAESILTKEGNKNDKAEMVNYHVKFKNNNNFKYDKNLNSSINNTLFDRAKKTDDSNWTTFYASENSDNPGYQMHIKTGKSKMQPKMENVKETIKKYDNAKEEE